MMCRGFHHTNRIIMPIKITWDNVEQTILRYEIWNEWTWHEFEQTTTFARSMVNSTPHRACVGYLFIIKNVTFPPNIIGISRVYLKAKNPRMCSIVVVN